MGTGFLLSPAESEALIAAHPRNRDVVFPYLNGEDLNSSPGQTPSRWVINFHDWSLEIAERFAEPFKIVREKVKPERDELIGRNPMATRRGTNWWLFAGEAKYLYEAIAKNHRVLVCTLVSKHLNFAFVPAGWVYANKCCAFAAEDDGTFALLQSSFHEVWARIYGSTLETRLNYSPTDCFETFPFPAELSGLESTGERYHEHRRQLMQARNEGLTKTYNRFHDPNETAPDIAELRGLHRELDIAVAAAYDWADLIANDGAALGHGFHETKQGLRFTLAPTARREILDRLLALNHQRYAEEVAAGLHEKKKPKASRKRKATAHTHEPRELALDFGSPSVPPTVTPLKIVPSTPTYVPTVPTGKRIAAPPEAFRTNLLRAILAAGGGSLSFDVLRDAFVLATRPALMQSMILPENAVVVEQWAKRREQSGEAVEPRDFLPALRDLGSNNLLVLDGPGGLIIALAGDHNPTLPKEARYDGWLAHRVAATLAPQSIPLDEIACSPKEAREALAA